MAKSVGTFVIEETSSNKLNVTLTIEPPRSSAGVGDLFYVPKSGFCPVISETLPLAGGRKMKIGWRVPAVRVSSEGVPMDVIELYVGQICKIDHAKEYAFPDNDLVKAYRNGRLLEEITGQVLEVTESKTIKSKTWDDSAKKYKRVTVEGVESFVLEDKTALAFNISATHITDEGKAEELLSSFYRAEYVPKGLISESDAEN